MRGKGVSVQTTEENFVLLTNLRGHVWRGKIMYLLLVSYKREYLLYLFWSRESHRYHSHTTNTITGWSWPYNSIVSFGFVLISTSFLI